MYAMHNFFLINSYYYLTINDIFINYIPTVERATIITTWGGGSWSFFLELIILLFEMLK